MTRTRPRNCYRSAVLQAITFRQWLKRNGLPDLDADYFRRMEMSMDEVTIEITFKGRERRLSLPTLTPGNIEPAVGRMAWWRQTSAADQAVLDRVDRVLDALARAASS